jgi:malonate-semialdehyde dehydrogenase (acetylating)/methylmalonate-semialdehyde dehydrogenase
MLGINPGVPAPMAFIPFGGRKSSLYRDLDAQGSDAVVFYTRKKVISECWFGSEGQAA